MEQSAAGLRVGPPSDVTSGMAGSDKTVRGAAVWLVYESGYRVTRHSAWQVRTMTVRAGCLPLSSESEH